ncbi:MAG: glycosyl hydrolase family 28-related protein [Armatimonadota bacterium]
MKKWMMLAALVTLTVSLASAGSAAAPQAARNIPELKWQKRSDWLDVKTDVQPAAKGDGVADDTAALQAALDTMQHGSTIFLPPGTYRITKTLVMKSVKTSRLLGTAIIGCGRATRIVWDGPTDPAAAMLWIKTGAAHTARYIGISWDGRGRAGFGIDHRSDTFETVVVHQHEAFRNFTDTGIRIGKGVYQSAEMLFENCLFEQCGQGLAYLSFNDYDNTIDGCEFRNCGIGLIDMHGNGYVRNSHFEGSTTCDLRIHSEHGSSIRRCTSVGSKAFLHFTAFVAPITVQQCHVAQWTNPDGPIIFGGDLAPVTIIDSIFSRPPNATPPLSIPSGPLVLSGNTVGGGGALLKGTRASIVEIPAGNIPVAALHAEHSFLKETVAIPGKVFDAKKDFGALGNGVADDTEAVQKTIDAARAHGQGAIAYLPRGNYLVSKTLSISGSNYYVGGSGSRTFIRWKGADRDVVMHVQDPDRVTLEHMTIAGNGDTDVLQTGTGKPSSMVYDGIYVYGMYQKNPWQQGLHLVGLSKDSTVLIRELTGNMRFTNCAQARILVNTSYYGNVMVDGKDKRRDGILGFLSRFSGEKPCTLYVKDNQNLVMSDYYVESAEQYAYLEGADGDPPGRVVIQGAKIHCAGHPLSLVPIAINNYAGLIMLGHQQFNNMPKPSLISWSGQRPCDLLLLGAEWYGTTPAIQRVSGADLTRTPLRAYALGCEVKSWNKETDKPVTQKFETIFQPQQEDTLAKAAQGLDDLRRLGQLDLELNHPDAWKSLRGEK